MKSEFPVKGNSAMIFIDDRVYETYCPDGVTPKAAFGGEYPVEWCTTKATGAQYNEFIGITLTNEVEEFSKTFDPNAAKWNFRGISTGQTAGFRLLDAKGNLIYAMAPAGMNIVTADIPENILAKVDRVEICYSNGKKILAVSKVSGIDETLTEEALNAEAGKKVYHDLTGRKVSSPVKGQIYVTNGKKVVF